MNRPCWSTRCRWTVLALAAVLLIPDSIPAQDEAPVEEAAATATPPMESEPVTPSSLDSAVIAVQTFIREKSASGIIDKSQSAWRTALPRFPDLTFTQGAIYCWVIQTNKGGMKFRLLADTAPQHVANFIYLTELGFFDGLSFHRVIPGFMAQGGCPLGTGTGDPGYRFGGEFNPAVTHRTGGLLSMANAGPGTDGSQFFITFTPTPWLDGKHSIFGEIVEGSDVLTRLEEKGSPGGRTSEPLSIDRATIVVETGS